MNDAKRVEQMDGAWRGGAGREGNPGQVKGTNDEHQIKGKNVASIPLSPGAAP